MDLTVTAVPFYFASMGAESWWLRRNGGAGRRSAGDYERSDTIASLSMGLGSLVLPLVSRPLMREFDVRGGRLGKLALGITGAALATTALADAVVRAGDLDAGHLPADDPSPDDADEAPAVAQRNRSQRRGRLRRIVARAGAPAAVTAVAGAGAIIAGTWANRTLASRMFAHRILPDWGNGAPAAAAAVLGWDFIYYWNHRIQHEARYLWAIHVVHHSSEHYNLSTALRQPVTDALGTFVPYGIMSWLGIRPSLIEQARGINLIYQFWIHTEIIASLGPLEKLLNTPSHHRVHHGVNRQYLDRNHGSILILWDRLFGTFEPEVEPVVYGLTKNIGTHNPLRVATHEYRDIISDVARSDNWSDRLGYVVRGPGWAYERRDTLGATNRTAVDA